MRIKWCTQVTGDELIYAREYDIKMYPYTSTLSIEKHLKDNSSSFTKEELLFLNELIESKDKDNLIIAFTIIDGK